MPTYIYSGKNVRFRLIGGRYRVRSPARLCTSASSGRAASSWTATARSSDGIFYDGFYSLNGSEEESLPDDPIWLPLAWPLRRLLRRTPSRAVGLAEASGILKAPCLLRRHNRC